MGLIVGRVSAFDMDALDSRIRELVTYARERDGEDRTTLFRSLVDMFLTGKAPVRQPTRGQLLDVIEALIPHVEPESRRTVSEILAGMNQAPMDLVHRLVRDRARLVEDLLVKAPFDEDEIIDLITATGREHHQILASRSDLSANVWIALARAAPAAPPFEGQSTLALWRDDLGTQETSPEEAATQKLEADAAVADDDQLYEELLEPKRAVAGGGASMMSGGHNDTGFAAATVTRLHPEQPQGRPSSDDRKSASLRILKTDEDLIAERMGDKPETPETKMVQGDGQAGSGHKLTASSTQSFAPSSLEIEEGSQETPKFLRDPGPGGWAWRSDRDGFVKIVSPFAARIFGGADQLIGTAMLDMLGLNTKLDHPVSRAFQRRSAIHDAPINLPNLGATHQFWTLEAAPVFSPSNGVFEGFEGLLTPVVPATDAAPEETDDWDTPLFLDDDNTPPQRASFVDNPSVLQSALEKKSAELPSAHDKTAESTQAEKAERSNPIADMINSTAAAMVREAVADVLAPLSPSEEEERYSDSEGDTAEKQQQASAANSSVPAEVLSTLTLLEEALDRLSKACEQGATGQVKLQTEIATSCVRALKSQLESDD